MGDFFHDAAVAAERVERELHAKITLLEVENERLRKTVERLITEVPLAVRREELRKEFLR